MRLRRLALSLTLPILAFASLLAIGGAAPALAQQAAEAHPLGDYQAESDHLPAAPGVTGGAAGGLTNPAAFATGDRLESALWWNDRSLERDALDNWGFAAGRLVNFAFNRRTLRRGGDLFHVDDYQLGLALGDRRRHVGLAYRWGRSGSDLVPREDALVLGLIQRPDPHYSLGLSVAGSVESEAVLGVADLGIRPLGRDWLTIFGDLALTDEDRLADGRWGAGLEIRPLPGLHLGVKFRDVPGPEEDYRWSLNLGITLAGHGLHVLPAYDEGGDLTGTTFLLRSAPSYRGLPLEPRLLPAPARWVPIDLENRRITYRRYRWFERKRVAWLDLARYLDALRRDDRVAGVALNLTGTGMSGSIAWELHRALQELRAAGKEVAIHIDRAGMLEFAVAAAADRLTMDPQGHLMLTGVSLQRTYLTGTLEKLGIGFQEFRHFTHKSAMETFSRTSMSEADREQRRGVVDAYYETARGAVCAGRGLTPAAFDGVVDEHAMVIAPAALRLGLVDALARWRDVRDWLAEERGARLWVPPPEGPYRRHHEEVWGRPPVVAVVYALGACAMDSGIRGRATSAHLRRLAGDPGVAAVVLRADSPGGEPLPSDLVAEAIRILQEAGKPVVVSQGDVAASGGYWIGMNGDAILTTPVTLTGSIGVIAGWFWDDGIGEKLGLSADGVHRGTHADLFNGLRFPFLGQRIPRRPLTDEELALVRALMLEMYDDFVGKVAAGRGLDEARVREIAEGRVWMGGEALARGLVDGYGGLLDAIDLAREKAGIPPGAEVRLTEFPPRPLLPLPSLAPPLPGLFGLSALADAVAARLGGGDAPADPAAVGAELAAAAPALPAAAGTAALLDAVALPGDPDTGHEELYLRTLARAAGTPILVVPPDLLPAPPPVERGF